MYARHSSDLPAELRFSKDSKLRFFEKILPHNGEETRQFCCEIQKKYHTEGDVYIVFQNLKNNRIDPKESALMQLPYVDIPGHVIVDKYGNADPKYILPADLFPEYVKSFVSDCMDELSRIIRDTVSTSRWTQNASGWHNPYAQVAFEFSLDRKTWRPLPQNTSGHISAIEPLDLSGEVLSKLQEILMVGGREPLAHELVREANETFHRTPRSALLISFVALETALAGC